MLWPHRTCGLCVFTAFCGNAFPKNQPSFMWGVAGWNNWGRHFLFSLFFLLPTVTHVLFLFMQPSPFTLYHNLTILLTKMRALRYMLVAVQAPEGISNRQQSPTRRCHSPFLPVRCFCCQGHRHVSPWCSSGLLQSGSAQLWSLMKTQNGKPHLLYLLFSPSQAWNLHWHSNVN